MHDVPGSGEPLGRRDTAVRVRDDDDRIDGRYLEIHKSILNLLATQAPVATDPDP